MSRIIDGGITYFSKPRPIYWEWLLFGVRSPLRKVLDVTLLLPQTSEGNQPIHVVLSDLLFGLEIELDPVSKWGRAREIKSSVASDRSSRAERLFGYGALIAYAYSFGILDLHNENVIFNSGRPQVVDAEIVFSKLLIPDETLLLPFKDVPFEDSALSLLFQSQIDIKTDDVEIIVSGFSQGLAAIDSSSAMIRRVCEELHSEMASTPIRVILRNTRKYYAHLDGSVKLELMPEELEQLARNEIPYFFKYIGKPELFYYSSASGESTQVKIPKEFDAAVDRIGRQPGELFTESRIRNQLFGPGLLLLMRKLLPADWQGRIEVGGLVLESTPDHLNVSSEWGTFKTSRNRGGG